MNLEYCNFYKKLLIEELVFCEKLSQLHYGNCAIIGKIIFEQDNFYLINVQLDCLPSNYQIPEGTVKVLLDFGLLPNFPEPGETYEIYGEAGLHDNKVVNKIYFVTVKYLLEKLQLPEFKETNQEILEDFNKLKEQYQVTIQVHSLNKVVQTNELIDCNLQIRNLQFLIEQKSKDS